MSKDEHICSSPETMEQVAEAINKYHRRYSNSEAFYTEGSFKALARNERNYWRRLIAAHNMGEGYLDTVGYATKLVDELERIEAEEAGK